MTKVIVSRDSLQAMLNDTRPRFAEQVIGKALVQIFRRQTESEQASNTTNNLNNIGFAGCDARSGSIHAKYFIKHRKLDQWMIDKWLKIGRSGYSRLTKYHRQLNEIAIEKQKK